jgi:hypothetical protein
MQTKSAGILTVYPVVLIEGRDFYTCFDGTPTEPRTTMPILERPCLERPSLERTKPRMDCA